MSDILYIIGEPGSGKSTLVAAMTRGLSPVERAVPYVAWLEYSPKVAQLGRVREDFSGTDALSMAAQNHVIDWLAGESDFPIPRYIVAEGDRLANAKFFRAVEEQGHKLKVIALVPPDDVLERRRHKRNKQLGRAQNERWLKTRKTKTLNLLPEADLIIEETELREVLRTMNETTVGRQLLRMRRRARANS